ncbi:RNA recognition motif domain containing protein [Babesia bovis T2Bo]|uniref:RNA recognition motif domain containing protein n=1 Tax=Babesia bovis T2Bo TaxID=484906 RepID=UPI001D3BC970|nr:RNA recognition motif domain containing protein [Babesia bovis T2Bo]KAG6439912.1 RNA recognition motif domain containing protein [Babesia bovis T2Bo]
MQQRAIKQLEDCSWRLLLKGLPFDVTQQDIFTLFKHTDSITSITILTKGNTPTGSAIVRFASENDVTRALKSLKEPFIRKRKVEATLDITDFSHRIQTVHKPIAVDRFRLPRRYF